MDPSSGEEERDGMRLAKARKLACSISIVHEFKPGHWEKVGDVTVHRAQKSREPVLKLGDAREVVDFPLRVDSEIDKKHKDKEHKGKEPAMCECGSPRCDGPCLPVRIAEEYREYIAEIRATSTPIRPFCEWLAHRQRQRAILESSTNAAASAAHSVARALEG